MSITAFSPSNWTWQDEMGFAQANLVVGAIRTLYCSGQAAVDADGNPVTGDMGAQIGTALDNLEAVLATAEMTFANVVQLTAYTTDLEAFMANFDVLTARFGAMGSRVVGTSVGVTALADPELLVEIDAVAIA